MTRTTAWGVGAVLTVLALAGVGWLVSRGQVTFEPPERQGPPALIETGRGAQLWLATRQVETRSYRLPRSQTWVLETRYHLRVQAHAPETAQRTWLKELALVIERSNDRRVVNAGPVRLLGQERDVVWAWVHDQVLALSADDASVRADRARFETANPSLAGLFPTSLDEVAWFGGMVVTLVDGRRVRLTLPDFRAEPWTVPAGQERAFDRAAAMSHTYWGGAYTTPDFGVRHTAAGGRWVGLLSDREARDAEDDANGDHFAGSEWIADEGRLARRGFWLATSLGRTPERRGEPEPRLQRLERLPGTGDYLQGRMLKGARAAGEPEWQWRGVSARPAPREPLRLADQGVLVLFRTRLDDQGQLGIARTTADYRERWRVLLPLDELQNRWQVGDRLVFMGSAPGATGSGGARRRELLLTLDTEAGRWSGWDVATERAVSPTP